TAACVRSVLHDQTRRERNGAWIEHLLRPHSRARRPHYLLQPARGRRSLPRRFALGDGCLAITRTTTSRNRRRQPQQGRLSSSAFSVARSVGVSAYRSHWT